MSIPYRYGTTSKFKEDSRMALRRRVSIPYRYGTTYYYARIIQGGEND